MVTVMFRPNDVRLEREEAGPETNMYQGFVKRTVYLGSRLRCEVEVASTKILAEVPSSRDIKERQAVSVHIPPDQICVLAGN